MTKEQAFSRIDELSEKLRQYQYEYFVLARTSVGDREYDRLLQELQDLEREYPELLRADSPTLRVGSDLSADLPEVDHTIPVLSLDKGYTREVILEWAAKTVKSSGRSLSFVAEEKIDGVSIVLYYEKGVLTRAVTRGNGSVGNDVTANVRTIGSVPLRLPEDVNAAVRGEIYLPKSEFTKINETMETPYANPRNLAAGTIRRQKSREAAEIPLTIFCYEGFFETAFHSHLEVLERLEVLGFRLNQRIGFFSDFTEIEEIVSRHPGWMTGSMDDFASFIEKETAERDSLDYEIDGLVIKVNELEAREGLGYTGHHPKWAIAYKFEAPQGISEVKAVDIQVGRTGRITPVARIEPVLIGGSTVSNVTLHNQEYIALLDLAVGDTVAVSKRGDVIPAVEKVIDKNERGNTVWRMPARCPSCGSSLVSRGAHHFCANREHCPAQVRGRLEFFIGTGRMDIENFGPETMQVLIDRGMVQTISDIYTADYDLLKDLPGFGDRKVALIKEGVEKSKERPFRTVLLSLGIPELGRKAAELLIDAGYTDIEKLFECADRDDIDALVKIPGIGEKTARTILDELSNQQLRAEIQRLREAGLRFWQEEPVNETEDLPRIFTGQTWCVTGSFVHFNPRSAAMEEVKKRGGRTTGSVSGSTTHLLAGTGAGSKLAKAEKSGTVIVSEDEFIELLKNSGWEEP